MKNNFSILGKEVIQAEINALKKLKSSINKDFDRIVNSILKCKGKVIFSGVGKSGIISNKISSTLSSLGIPSFYVDAGSCSHGDLGMITSGDILIIISHSGETSELKNLIQYTKRNKNIRPDRYGFRPNGDNDVRRPRGRCNKSRAFKRRVNEKSG